MKKRAKLLIAFGAAFVIVGTAYAQFSNPEDAIRYRQSVMFMMSHHLKAIGTEIQKSDVNHEEVASDAQTLAFLATLPWEAMATPGSDRGDTQMKSEVLTRPDAFKKAAEKLEDSTQHLASVAETADLGKIKGAFGTVAGDCRACHSQFRK